MNLETELVLAVLLVLVWLDIIIVLRTLSNKSELGISADRRRKELAELAHLFEIDSSWDKKKVKRLFDNYLRLKQSINLPDEERRKILRLAGAEKMEPNLARKLRYQSRYSRMEAALGLALIGSETARLTLENALSKESDYPTKLYIANALSDIGNLSSLPALTESLMGSHRWYRDKVNMVIASFGQEAMDYFRSLFGREESEIIELLLDVSTEIVCEDLRNYLLGFLVNGQEAIARISDQVRGCPDRCCAYCIHGRQIDAENRRICPYKGKVAPDFACARWSLLVTSKDPAANHRRLMVKAAECLECYYSLLLDDDRFLGHSDPAIRNVAVRSLGNGRDEKQVARLVSFLGEESTMLSAKLGLSRILEAHPRLVPSLADLFHATPEGALKPQLADVLAGRIEYFIAKLNSNERKAAAQLIREILILGKASEIIEFLKVNKDREIEDEMVSILQEAATDNEALTAEFCLYLSESILIRLGLERTFHEQKKREEKKDLKMIRSLYFITAFAFSFFPILYLIRYADRVRYIPFVEQVKTFIVDFNYDFAWYSISVNAVYLILLALSAVKVKSLTRLWNLKTMSMLFKHRMLPTVSIIAPAFNEARTIIESVNSLLNLKYPE